MDVIFSAEAQEDFDSFEKALKIFFKSHLIKLSKMPPRRHLKHGLPWNVEDVTKQARLVYLADGDILRIIRCFAAHKDYEKWYQSYR